MILALHTLSCETVTQLPTDSGQRAPQHYSCSTTLLFIPSHSYLIKPWKSRIHFKALQTQNSNQKSLPQKTKVHIIKTTQMECKELFVKPCFRVVNCSHNNKFFKRKQLSSNWKMTRSKTSLKNSICLSLFNPVINFHLQLSLDFVFHSIWVEINTNR